MKKSLGKVHSAKVGVNVVGDWSAERPDLDHDIQLIRARLVRIEAKIRFESDRSARNYGISGAEMRILFALRRTGAPYRLRPTDLFEALLVPSATMTRQLAHLEQLGYVGRIADVDDRRVTLVFLTPRGVQVADEALTEAVQRSHFTQVLKTLSPSERSVLNGYLGRLAAALDL
jgi:DNA-binding MarR family transcriptional regulator